jgi:hypothetical protein
MTHPRRKTLPVHVGRVVVGGTAPIVVQSMTNTDTANIEGTAQQIKALARAGSELVRITVNEASAAAAVAPIRDRLAALGVNVPSSATSTSTVTSCCANIPSARKRWPSTASTPATSAADPGAIRSSPR